MKQTKQPSFAALLAAVPVALLLAAILDLATAPMDAWTPASVGFLLQASARLLWIPLAILCFGLLSLRALSHRPRAQLVLLSATGSGISLVSYLTLISYQGFSGYLPFLLAWIFFALLLSAGYVWVIRGRRAPLLLGAGGAALVGILGSLWLTSENLDGRYPSLLESLFQVRFFLMHLLLSTAARAIKPSPRWTWGTALSAVASAGACLLFLHLTNDENDRALLRERSALGLTMATRAKSKESCAEEDDALSQEKADELFERYSGLPELPESFRVENYNLLLVTVEAVRSDAVLRREQAPNLAQLAADGGWSFQRAYAPASRTWLSIAALFAMRLPSQTRILTKIPPWTGDLLPEEVTVAEGLSAAGYKTRAVRHDFKGNEGLNQGFAEVHEEHSPVIPREVIDHNLASRSIDALEELSATSRPFFLWTFFASPHRPYTGSPGDSWKVRYADSVRHFDLQLGRVLSFLRRKGLHDKTIIIVTADHGEVIRKGHGTNLKSEVIQVPLVVSIPGLKGKELSAPTSQVYLFPWLLRSSEVPALSGLAKEAIREFIAPTLQASHGAVIAELIDRNMDKTSLIWTRAKFDYNFRSGRAEIFDPGALSSGNLLGHPKMEPFLGRFEKYRSLRSCLFRAVLSDVAGPRRNHARETRPGKLYNSPWEDLGE